MQCVVCSERPVRTGTKFCWQCTEAGKKNAPEKAPDRFSGAKFLLAWKGHLIKLVASRTDFDEEGMPMLRAVYMGQGTFRGAPKEVPRLDLNTWLPGYDRKQITKMKSVFRSMVPKIKHVYKDGSHRMVSML